MNPDDPRWAALKAGVILGVVLIICGAFTTGPARAHLLPKQTATMNIKGKAAFFVVSVPASALSDVDDDDSGTLSGAELNTYKDVISKQFGARFHVSDAGIPGATKLTWVVPPQTDRNVEDSDYVVILHRVNFVAPPRSPTVSTDLFGTGPGEDRMTFKATSADRTEVAILQKGSVQYVFFQSGWAKFGQFFKTGLDHILFGIDHLLFLLTVVIAAAGWRYWLAIITTFTAAHSITLALSTLGIFKINPALVEPGIAASIVVMAGLNLAARGGAGLPLGQRASWLRIGLVFACGLLHGFGFAAFLSALSVDTTSRIATLAGFNLGVEAGQFVFVLALAGLVAVLRTLGATSLFARVPQLASLAAVCIGCAMLYDRMSAA